MTEKEFWSFLRGKISRHGAVPQVSGYIDTETEEARTGGRYCGGHAMLFKGYDTLPQTVIREIGELLFKQNVSLNAKESVLMLLAHHPTKIALQLLKRYADRPDYRLRYFAAMAYEECKMWNE